MDVASEMAALRARVDATRRPQRPARQPAARVADIGAAVRAELARQEAVRAEAARRAGAARWLPPGGRACWYCGFAGRSARHDEHGRLVPWWGTDGPGGALVCAGCDADRLDMPGNIRPPDEHRVRVARSLLPVEVSRWWLDEYLLDRVDFRWFGEIDRAQPSDQARFAYVDVAAMVARLEAPPPAPAYETADPCPKCGEAAKWLRVEPREESRLDGGVRKVSTWPAGWICGGCRYDDRPERMRLTARWRSDNADRQPRPVQPDLPPHPLAAVTLWPSGVPT